MNNIPQKAGLLLLSYISIIPAYITIGLYPFSLLLFCLAPILYSFAILQNTFKNQMIFFLFQSTTMYIGSIISLTIINQTLTITHL